MNKWPKLAAATKTSRKNTINEDLVCLKDDAALFLDGSYGRGGGYSIPLTQHLNKYWLHIDSQMDVLQEMKCLSRRAIVFNETDGDNIRTAAACSIRWSPDGRVQIASVGDIAVYLLSENQHVSYLLSPNNDLSNFLGMRALENEDICHISTIITPRSSCIAALSDGAWRNISLLQLQELYRKSKGNPKVLATSIIDAASILGGDDDATAFVIG